MMSDKTRKKPWQQESAERGEKERDESQLQRIYIFPNQKLNRYVTFSSFKGRDHLKLFSNLKND